ncbi:MAG: bifunctional diaminohydroxyphosphoribosylaminopyrimidine deaminase/5-amino-6-(5-phosphoribosylamino)uracil reductase RibD [Pseudomonadota bacterium]
MGTAHTDLDLTMMRRALALAGRGAGFTAPNPVVGCVIARGDQIVGEGWHRGHRWHREKGQAHAEIEALREAGDRARGGAAYVTLEPCNHTGKTPPCADALIKAGVARVVIAAQDPNPAAAGGINTLRAAGIVVETGVCEAEALAQTRAWRHQIITGRPFIVAKFAASLDGKIATRTGDSQWITGPKARKRSHDLRQLADAIIVGTGTVLSDNPALTVRGPAHPSHPLRVIVDSTARTSPMAKVFHGPGRSLLATTDRAPADRLAAFSAMDVDILRTPSTMHGRTDLDAVLDHLAATGVTTVMVEGGSTLLGSFFDAGLIDEVWAFLAPMVIGGGKNPFGGAGASSLSDALQLDHIETETLGRDILIRGQVGRTLSSSTDQQQGASLCSQA